MILADAIDWIRVPLAVALVLVVVVGIHEFGHFIFAKIFGIRVDEFSLGFGPKLLGRQHGETLYALRAVPAGGFVRMAGMSGLPGEADAGERNFIRASIPARLITIAAGGVINLIFAGILFGVVAMFSVSSSVSTGSAAAAAGLRSGDVVTAVNGHHLNLASQDSRALGDSLRAAVQSSQGRPIPVDYTDSGGNAKHTEIRPQLVVADNVGDRGDPSHGTDLLGGAGIQVVISGVNGHPPGVGDPSALLGGGGPVVVDGFEFGNPSRTFTGVTISRVGAGDGAALGRLQAVWRIGYGNGVVGKAPLTALAGGIIGVPGAILDTFRGVRDVITTPGTGGITGGEGLSGPVGIVQATAVATHNGVRDFVGVMALISLSLGVLNLLPIPFLDGGRLLFVVIEAVRRRRVDPRREAMVHVAGLAVLVAFALYITVFGDLGRVLQ